MKKLTFDVETTMNCDVGGNKAHPMHPANKIVYVGAKVDSESDVSVNKPLIMSQDEQAQLVGHNLGFDIKYVMNHAKITGGPALQNIKWFIEKADWFDTQSVEYIITGQQARMSSLAGLQMKYLGTVTKDEEVKGYFEKGLGAEVIPQEVIVPYLKDDVTTTEAISKCQEDYLAKTPRLLPLVAAMMEAKKAFVMAEFHGMKVDSDILKAEAVKLECEKQNIALSLIMLVPLLGGIMHSLDLTSPKQLATYLFGGDVTVEKVEQDGFYKNGNPKFKRSKVVHKYDGEVAMTTRMKLVNAFTPGGGWSTNDDVLTQLRTMVGGTVGAAVEQVLKYRNVTKELGTYYNGLLERIFPDGFIYGNINTCIAATGRTTSSDPNLQNIKNSPCKRAFVSRWGAEGKLVEFDYSQLEIVVLAHISKDAQLIDDIVNGRDIHSELYRDMYGRYPSKAERKEFKPLTFGLVYGAGYKSLAHNAGVSEDIAKRFIVVFYKRYPMTLKHKEWMVERAKNEGTYMKGKRDEDNKPVKTWEYISETGRSYHFQEYKNDWNKAHSFSPNELMNYPVQGMATGDIVPMMAGIVFRALYERFGDDALLVNVIHDSFLLDVKYEVVDDVVSMVWQLLERAPEFYELYFSKKFSLVNLKVGCNVGSNWYEMKELDRKDWINE